MGILCCFHFASLGMGHNARQDKKIHFLATSFPDLDLRTVKVARQLPMWNVFKVVETAIITIRVFLTISSLVTRVQGCYKKENSFWEISFHYLSKGKNLNLEVLRSEDSSKRRDLLLTEGIGL